MNIESIRSLIKGLGKSDFDGVVAIVIKHVFKLMPLSVDGSGDCGSDVTLFCDGMDKETAIQVTVQKKGWQEKVLGDARKVFRKLKCRRFYAFVNIECDESEKRNVAETIFDELAMASQIYTVREIASFIEEENLHDELLDTISPNWRESKHKDVDMSERLLYSYVVMSNRGADVQNEIFDSTILFSVCESGRLGRADIIARVAERLQLSEEEQLRVSGRIDSLLSRSLLVKDESALQLSDKAAEEAGLANSSYVRDMDEFSKICHDVISGYGGHASNEDLQTIAGNVARCYLKNQVDNLRRSSLTFRYSGFDRSLQDAEDKITESLMQCGIRRRIDCEDVKDRIIRDTCGSELIKKLLSAVVYACLRDVANTRLVSVLNVSSWEDVKVFLDASVAIPYLVSKEFEVSEHRHSQGAISIMKACAKLRVKTYLPREYLNECAAHLVDAYDVFCVPYADFDFDLANSHNGYVAHYFQRKLQADDRLPKSLSQYIARLSRSAADSTLEYKERVARVERDLEELFIGYQFEIYDAEPIDKADEKRISIVFSQILNTKKRSRGDIQVFHDVQVVGKLSRKTIKSDFGKVLLTWDTVLIDSASQLQCNFWATNPIVAGDIVQARYRLSDSNYLSLGIALARTRNRRDDVAGRFVDRMMTLCREKLLNTQYREKILELKKEVVARCLEMDDNEVDANMDVALLEYDAELKDRF